MTILTIGDLRALIKDMPDYYTVLDDNDEPPEMFLSTTNYGLLRVTTAEIDFPDWEP